LNTAKPLRFLDFNSQENPLVIIKQNLKSIQSSYLFQYLKDLDCKSLLIEDNYFDRDFLSEVSAVYCLSAKGYPNVCKRLHFFSSELTREKFALAAGSDEKSERELNEHYLGFIVIRPINGSPFGRTVLKWYADLNRDTPRITQPARVYVSSLAGVELSVNGLAWQQQDSGVAACATIGIWSMLHSSAFDARHAIPTTSIITEAAHSSALVGHQTYPSYSLTYPQIQHAIKQLGFSPSYTSGDQPGQFFSKSRFANICAAYIRSGYPLMIGGSHEDGGIGHAVCALGFREVAVTNTPVAGEVYLQDEEIEYIYVHDDNIGPNVRFKLEEETYSFEGGISTRCVMKMEKPGYLESDETPNLDNTSFYPKAVIAAVHNDLMISSDGFFRHGIILTGQLCNILNTYLRSQGFEEKALAFSSRFLMLKEYLKDELERQLFGQPELLSSVRMQLQENVAPMSLHLAILRIALPDSSIMVDVIFDTTDTDKNKSVFCHVVFDETLARIIEALPENMRLAEFGAKVAAYIK